MGDGVGVEVGVRDGVGVGTGVWVGVGVAVGICVGTRVGVGERAGLGEDEGVIPYVTPFNISSSAYKGWSNPLYALADEVSSAMPRNKTVAFPYVFFQ